MFDVVVVPCCCCCCSMSFQRGIVLAGILRYQVDFQMMEPMDDLEDDFDLDDY